MMLHEMCCIAYGNSKISLHRLVYICVLCIFRVTKSACCSINVMIFRNEEWSSYAMFSEYRCILHKFRHAQMLFSRGVSFASVRLCVGVVLIRSILRFTHFAC